MDKTYEIHITNSNQQLESFLKFTTNYLQSEWGDSVRVKTP